MGNHSREKIVILQSNYLPWRGYFDLIHDADLFLFYDEVQYTVRDWRNRNHVYAKQGRSWITVPCGSKTDHSIQDTKILADTPWQQQHWNLISNAYAKTPYFGRYRDFFESVYFEMEWAYLSDLNQYLIRKISNDFLGIKTDFDNTRNYASHGAKGEKLISIVKAAGGSTYISGPAAKSYIHDEEFAEAGVELVWKDYSGYPEYPQQNPVFEPAVSIIDLLFNTGPEAPYYIWGWREDRK